MKKTLLYNFLVFLFLVFIFTLTPPILLDSYRFFYNHFKDQDYRVELNYYKNKSWAKKHFSELTEQDFKYYDFIGWRKKPYRGETININSNGFRFHNNFDVNETDIWVFGGSTVFGTGSKDKDTIPGLIEAKTDKKTFNMGENAYVIHQDLNLLMKMTIDNKINDKTIIFYGGGNDVIHKCRSELNFYSTAQEEIIRKKLATKKGHLVGNYDRGFFFLKIFEPTIEVISRIKKKIQKSKSQNKIFENYYDCHKNNKKMREIVNSIISDWELANYISERGGGKFLAVLQPISHFSRPNIDHLNYLKERKIEKKQFEVVYNEIQNQMKLKDNFNFLDLTEIFDTNEEIYIDYVHVTPFGNEKIAEKIIDYLKSLSF